jgi:gamma-glutamyltranspeptidase/glutathione hydrolase
LASGVPGEPAGIAELLKRFGRLPRKKVVAPALRLAEDGATVSPALARMSKYFAAQMKKDPVMTKWFEPGADALRAGATFRQPELARTLRAFARKGRDAIYEGRIARAIARSNKRAGGVMTVEDLAAYEVVEREPMMAERFGHRWATAPPPSAGGFTMLQSLALLERWAPRWKASEAARLHALAESWKGPFMDRQVFVGDPDHVDVPLDAMMASTRMDRRAAVFHPALALPPDDYELPIDGHPEHDAVQPEGGGTSHLCVVDEDGNVASVTTTVNLPFGARYTAAGMVMNDEMDDFAREVGKKNAFGLPGGAPNLPGPSRRPVSTMSPTIVFDEAGPVLCVGAAGGSRIVTATEQVAFNVVVSGMSVADALLHPRVHHQGKPNQLRTEETHPLGREVVDALKARGHEHEHIDHAAVVQAIRIVRDGDEVTLQAGSDPRKGGLPAGQ